MSAKDEQSLLSRKRRSSPDVLEFSPVDHDDPSKRPKERQEAARSADDSPNWRDVLLRAAEPCQLLTQAESRLLDQAASDALAALATLKTPGRLNYELDRSLSQGLENYEAMTEQLSIFLQPLVTFCRLVFDCPLCRDHPHWNRELAVALAKVRVHAMFVPVFSLVYDAGELSFVIDGKPYKVSTKRPLLTEESTPIPGLSAVQASHRYYEYVRRVTGGRRQLLIVLGMLKLFDVSLVEKSLVPADLPRIAFDLFTKSAALARRALFTHFGDAWLEKLREFSILFEWSKTFELSVATLFNNFTDKQPEPLFPNLYSD